MMIRLLMGHYKQQLAVVTNDKEKVTESLTPFEQMVLYEKKEKEICQYIECLNKDGTGLAILLVEIKDPNNSTTRGPIHARPSPSMLSHPHP